MGIRPRVSVIVAAYNVESYIEKAMTSALRQSIQEIEIIVVDDASCDRTSSIVRKLSDPRVKLVQNDLNAGPAFSRNIGIAHAQGDWIAILDADDWWELNRLEMLLGIAEQNGAHIVSDDLYLIEDGAEAPWNTYFKSRERVLGPIDKVIEITSVKMVDDDYGILQPIIRRDFLVQSRIRYKEHLIFAEDYVFVLDCLLAGAKMLICPEAYYYYRARPASLTNTELANTEAQYNVLLELVTQEPYSRLPDVYKSLQSRLKRLELALREIRARELLRQKGLVKAASFVVTNPALLISYVRQMKRHLLPRVRRLSEPDR